VPRNRFRRGEHTWNVDQSIVRHGDILGLVGIGEGTGPSASQILALDAKPVAREKDTEGCPQHGTVPLQPVTPTNYLVDGREVIRVGDFGLCGADMDIVMEGAATFVVCGLPVARVDDKMMHGGVILEGSQNMIIGGPTFALPSNITIDGTPKFKSKTICDMYFLSTTNTGQEIFDRLAKTGQPVCIEERPTGLPSTKATSKKGPLGEDDGLGKADPDDTGRSDQRSYQPTGSNIKYNPDEKGCWVEGPDGKMAEPPQVGLAHELVHAVHNGEGTSEGPYEEASTIGYELPPEKEKQRKEAQNRVVQAQHRKKFSEDTPTENDFRDELGLPRRKSYDGKPGWEGETRDFRPGKCFSD
jgi:uncharacterized Zn-binding protein involved in type VI secretion